MVFAQNGDQVPATMNMIMDVEMDEDKKSAALRNHGLVRQVRHADNDLTTGSANLKHQTKAGRSGTARQLCVTQVLGNC